MVDRTPTRARRGNTAPEPDLLEPLRRHYPRARFRWLPPSQSARHRVVTFSSGGRAYFAKTPVAPEADLVVERAVLAALSRTSIAPQVVRPPVDRWLITRALPGRARAEWSDRELVLVGGALAAMHRVRVPAAVRPLPGGAQAPAVLREAKLGLDSLRKASIVDAGTARAMEAALADARARWEALPDDGEPVRSALCHGDVRGPNVLFTADRAAFVDFEHAGRGDPAIDLARVASYQRLSLHHWFRLIDAYAEESGDDTISDRADALLPTVRLSLLLHALRRAVEIAHGHITVADELTWAERTRAVASRWSEILERPVRYREPARRGRR